MDYKRFQGVSEELKWISGSFRGFKGSQKVSVKISRILGEFGGFNPFRDVSKVLNVLQEIRVKSFLDSGGYS